MNEIVITMSERDFDFLRGLWIDAWEVAETKKRKEDIRRFVNRTSHNADKLTLKWLDEKRAEFP